MVRFGPPKLSPSIEALGRFSQGAVSARPPVPISLSFLSEQIIALALRAPDVRTDLTCAPLRDLVALIIVLRFQAAQ